MKGFFTVDAPAGTRRSIPLLPACGECGLYRGKDCKSPKIPVQGRGKKGILIVGDTIGNKEDQEGRHLTGSTNQVIRDALQKFDIDIDRDCWHTSAMICKGPKNPASDKIAHCRPNVVKVITELKPERIILLGPSAVKSVIGWLWKEDVGMPSRWDGWLIPSQQINAWVTCTFHPSWFFHRDKHGNDDKDNAMRRMKFDEHLKVICQVEGRPWNPVPDYKSQVRIAYDPSEAAKMVDAMTEGSRPVAIDLETTTLSPDGPHAEIYTCALSDGKTSVAFPWHGEAIKAVKRFCVSPVPKLGQNIKFENRWIMRKLGVWIQNWKWDGMIGAHVLDNRPSICGLAFQAFVNLGFTYKDMVSQYLKSKDEGSHSPNRIREAPLDALLLYNGLDSLIEWNIDHIQAKQLGISIR